VWKKLVSDLVWYTGSILGLSDHPYFSEPWYGGPRLSINHENASRHYSETGLSGYYGDMKSILPAPIEELLNLTPLDALIVAEARMTLYRLHISKQPTDLKSE
jgi:hypothetical protein